jgi:hypothetical protein
VNLALLVFGLFLARYVWSVDREFRQLLPDDAQRAPLHRVLIAGSTFTVSVAYALLLACYLVWASQVDATRLRPGRAEQRSDPKTAHETAQVAKVALAAFQLLKANSPAAHAAIVDADRCCNEVLSRGTENPTLRLIAAECANNLAVSETRRGNLDSAEKFTSQAVQRYEHALSLRDTHAVHQEYDACRLLQCAIQIDRATRDSATDRPASIVLLRETIDRLKNLPDVPTSGFDRQRLLQTARQRLQKFEASAP